MLTRIEKHNQWQTLTESDFITLYIKTWFAYIAVLRSFSPETPLVDPHNRPVGDKPFLEIFREKILPEAQKNIDINEVAQNLFSLYPLAVKKTAETLPTFFFKVFFKYNENFMYKNIDLSLNVKLRHKNAEKGKGKFYTIVVDLWFKETFRNKKYHKNLSFELDFEPLVERVVAKYTANYNQETVSDLSLVKSIYEELLKELEQKLEAKQEEVFSQTTYSNTVKNKIKSFCRHVLTDLRQQFNNNYLSPFDTHQQGKSINSFAAFKQQPFLGFENALDNGEYKGRNINKDIYYDELLRSDGLLWFSHFVYGLRNILFHEIIDPFDREWQKIFKHSYLILKPIVDICIGMTQSEGDYTE